MNITDNQAIIDLSRAFVFPPPSDQIGPRPPRTKLEHFQRAETSSYSWSPFNFEHLLRMDQQVGTDLVFMFYSGFSIYLSKLKSL